MKPDLDFENFDCNKYLKYIQSLNKKAKKKKKKKGGKNNDSKRSS